MGEICIGDVRSLFKSNYVGRLTRSQVVAFQIVGAAAGGPPRARRRESAAHLHTELNSSIRSVSKTLLSLIRTKFGDSLREERDGDVSLRRTDCSRLLGKLENSFG